MALRLPILRTVRYSHFFLLFCQGMWFLWGVIFSPSPSERFALSCSALCRAVAASIALGVAAAMIVLVWTRVRRAEVAFLALLARVQAGTYRGGWVRVRSVEVADADRVRVVRVVSDRGRLPLRFGWLMGVMPSDAAGFAEQLRTVFAEPEMAAVLADVPQARRILGPVCRMLGVAIPGVRDPAVDAGEVRVVRVRVARVRRVVEPWRIPLLRGVLVAARRQGYGRVPKY